MKRPRNAAFSTLRRFRIQGVDARQIKRPVFQALGGRGLHRDSGMKRGQDVWRIDSPAGETVKHFRRLIRIDGNGKAVGRIG